MFEETSIHMAGEQRIKDNILENIILAEAIHSLPIDQKAIVALISAGFKQAEIVIILGISRTTIWSKKTEAYQSLRQYLVGG
jgi:DNA-directed RNA polymerase specialized sigma24 family protein